MNLTAIILLISFGSHKHYIGNYGMDYRISNWLHTSFKPKICLI